MKILATTTLALTLLSASAFAGEKTRFEMTPAEKAKEDQIIAWQNAEREKDEVISQSAFLQVHLGPKDGAGPDQDND